MKGVETWETDTAASGDLESRVEFSGRTQGNFDLPWSAIRKGMFERIRDQFIDD